MIGILFVNESSRLTNKIWFNTMKKQRRGLNRYNVTVGDSWTAKQQHWKSEANEDHQLSPGGPSNRRKSPVRTN